MLNHNVQVYFLLHLVFMLLVIFFIDLKLLHEWDQTGCAKVVVKAPDEETLYVTCF